MVRTKKFPRRRRTVSLGILVSKKGQRGEVEGKKALAPPDSAWGSAGKFLLVFEQPKRVAKESSTATMGTGMPRDL